MRKKKHATQHWRFQNKRSDEANNTTHTDTRNIAIEIPSGKHKLRRYAKILGFFSATAIVLHQHIFVGLCFVAMHMPNFVCVCVKFQCFLVNWSDKTKAKKETRNLFCIQWTLPSWLTINKWKMNWSPFEIELLYHRHRHCRRHCGRFFSSRVFCYFRQIAIRQTHRSKSNNKNGTNETWSTNGAQPIQKVVRVHRKAAFWPLFRSSCSSFHISFASKSKFCVCVLCIERKRTNEKKIKLSFYFGFSDACAKVVPLFWLLYVAFYDSICSHFLFVWNFAYENNACMRVHVHVCGYVFGEQRQRKTPSLVRAEYAFCAGVPFNLHQQVRPNKQLNASKMHKTKCFRRFFFLRPDALLRNVSFALQSINSSAYFSA